MAIEFGIAALTKISRRANIITGCENNCVYCSAKYLCAVRMKQFDPCNWSKMIVREDRIREWALYSTPVMFPTSHDITQSVYAPCLEQLKNLLRAGNEVLIGTKPRFWVIEHLISDLYKYRKQVSFQFTISTLHDKRIRMWEPGASRVAERLKCLQMAKKARYQTNVSIEPCLDVEDVHAIVDRVNPWVTDTIWVGPLNVKKEFEDFDLHVDCNRMKQWWGAPMRHDHERLLIKYGEKVQFTKTFRRKMQG